MFMKKKAYFIQLSPSQWLGEMNLWFQGHSTEYVTVVAARSSRELHESQD